MMYNGTFVNTTAGNTWLKTTELGVNMTTETYARDVTVNLLNKFTLWEALYIKLLVEAMLDGREITIEPKQ